MIVLGIDPGQTGGLVLVESSTCKVLDAMMMPLATSTKKPTIDYHAAAKFLAHGVALAAIEEVHSMPRQGVASSFQFGRVFGAVEMVGQYWANHLIYVTPQKWKKHFDLIKRDKAASVALATELYSDKHWPLKKHEGVAEAALIATWAIETLECSE